MKTTLIIVKDPVSSSDQLLDSLADLSSFREFRFLFLHNGSLPSGLETQEVLFLNSEGEDKSRAKGSAARKISYQGFLERIFEADSVFVM